VFDVLLIYYYFVCMSKYVSWYNIARKCVCRKNEN
jgi:hypothetical protein